MSEKFTWVPFYKELAEKILAYKENRKELMKIIYSLPAQYTNYLQWKPSDGTGVENPEIDPFSIFGIFNRQITDKNRIEILSQFKDLFHIDEDIPRDFNGIPVFDNRRSFFESENAPEWNEELSNKFWDLYESAIIHSDNFSSCFDEITKLKGVSYGITFVLYFLNPDVYIALDGNNRKYLSNFGIELTTLPTGIQYLNLLDEVKGKMKSNVIPEKTFLDFSYTAWKGDYAMPTTNNCNDYVQLLKTNHNIILHGAPGTGKTHLAKKIANAMGEKGDGSDVEIGFVQFHPSYDYTDFVEGLRPKNGDDGQIGFERKDGVFKEFCGRALKNIIDSKKTTEEIHKEKTIQDVYDGLIFKIRNGEISELLQRTGTPIKILEITENDNLVFKTKDSEVKSTYTVSLTRLLKLAEVFADKEALQNIKNIDKEIRAVIGGCHSSSYWAALNWIYENSNLLDDTLNENTNSTERKNFIFIIDEINRGEISKIFGELFFSIDPGYRGEKGLVQTQYQNLVEEGDIFKKGFFVPENVYIIGTMNDIDRSVESMDFAMRRRFVFKEITAAQSAENMSLGDDVKRRMSALNDAISNIDGLGSSYHIGAAYFLKNGISISTEEEFNELWELRLESLLTEYLRGTGNESKLKDLKAAYEKGEPNLDNSESDE